MSGPDLREELERIALAAPVARVPADTFARGRRARRRDLGLVVGAAAAVVALVAGTAFWSPIPGRVPVADGDARLGVPAELHVVPDHVRREPETDLAIGTAAAAWFDERGLEVVVVDALTGGHHVLDLPDDPSSGALVLPNLLGNGSVPLALSPDGNHLAYGSGNGPGADPADAAVIVLDLTTGEVERVAAEGGAGVEVLSISWSPDSSWLVWRGQAWGRSDAGSRSGGEEIAGRIQMSEATTAPVPVPRSEIHTLTIDDEGTVVALQGSGFFEVPVGSTTLGDRTDLSLGAISGTARLDRAGQRVLVGIGLNGPRSNIRPGAAGLVLDLDAAKASGRGFLADDPGNQFTSTEALGWVGDSVVVARRAEDGRGTNVLMISPNGTSERISGSEEFGVPTRLTLATDLMTLDRPTVPRPEPDWPWSPQRISLLISLAVGALLVAAAAWLRSRRSSPGHNITPARSLVRDLATGAGIGVVLNVAWACGLVLTGLDDSYLLAYVTVPVATMAVGLAGAIGDRWWRGRGIGLTLSVPLALLAFHLWFTLT